MKKVIHRTLAAALVLSSVHTHALDNVDLSLGTAGVGAIGASLILGKAQQDEPTRSIKPMDIYDLNANDLKPLAHIAREDLAAEKMKVQEFNNVFVTSSPDVLRYKYVYLTDSTVEYTRFSTADGHRVFDSIKEYGEGAHVKINYVTVSYTTNWIPGRAAYSHNFDTAKFEFKGTLAAAKDALIHGLPSQEHVVQVSVTVIPDHTTVARAITDKEIAEKNAQIDKLNAERAQLRAELAAQNENIIRANLELERTGSHSQELLQKVKASNLRIKTLSRAAGFSGMVMLGLVVVRNMFGEVKTVPCQDSVCEKMLKLQQEALSQSK